MDEAAIDKTASKIARELDSGDRESAKEILSLLALKLHMEGATNVREIRNQVLKRADELEKDGVGDDLVIKYNKKDQPVHHSMITAAQHEKAKNIAESLDEGSRLKAAATIAFTDMQETAEDFKSIILAADAYEKQGEGGDIRVFYNKQGKPVATDISLPNDFSSRHGTASNTIGNDRIDKKSG